MKFNMVLHVKLSNYGKSDFLIWRHPDGTEEKVCVQGTNAEVAENCIAQVYGLDRVQEVIENKGRYTKENLSLYRSEGTLDMRCFYCSQRRVNWGPTPPRQVTKKTKDDFERIRPKTLRIGKNTEPGHPYYRESLLCLMALCAEYETQAIITTKMLEFDGRLLEIVKETDSVIQYSFGSDQLESGAVSQGFTNLWRLEQAIRYQEAGAHTTSIIVCDLAQSIDQNIALGFPLEEIIEAERKYGITKRLLPLRINSDKLSMIITGKPLRDIVAPTQYGNEMQEGFDFEVQEIPRPYGRRGNNETYIREVHPDFQEMIDDGTGICGRIGDLEYCDKCDLEGDTRVIFPVDEIVKVEYEKDNKRRRRAPKEQTKLRFTYPEEKNPEVS